MDVRAVQVEIRESIAHVTLTQPERGNPFDQAFCSQLREAAIGFVRDGAGTYFIPRRVGTRRAAEFPMLKQMWSAERAVEHGRVSTHDQPLETQLEFEARAISQCAKTGDSWNAIQAVLAKRKPECSGR